MRLSASKVSERWSVSDDRSTTTTTTTIASDRVLVVVVEPTASLYRGGAAAAGYSIVLISGAAAAAAAGDARAWQTVQRLFDCALAFALAFASVAAVAGVAVRARLLRASRARSSLCAGSASWSVRVQRARRRRCRLHCLSERSSSASRSGSRSSRREGGGRGSGRDSQTRCKQTALGRHLAPLGLSVARRRRPFDFHGSTSRPRRQQKLSPSKGSRRRVSLVLLPSLLLLF